MIHLSPIRPSQPYTVVRSVTCPDDTSVHWRPRSNSATPAACCTRWNWFSSCFSHVYTAYSNTTISTGPSKAAAFCTALSWRSRCCLCTKKLFKTIRYSEWLNSTFSIISCLALLHFFLFKKWNNIWDNDSLSILSWNASEVHNVFGPTVRTAFPVYTSPVQTRLPSFELLTEYETVQNSRNSVIRNLP